MYLAIFVGVGLESFLHVGIDGVGVVEIELSIRGVGIFASCGVEESCELLEDL